MSHARSSQSIEIALGIGCYQYRQVIAYEWYPHLKRTFSAYRQMCLTNGVVQQKPSDLERTISVDLLYPVQSVARPATIVTICSLQIDHLVQSLQLSWASVDFYSLFPQQVYDPSFRVSAVSLGSNHLALICRFYSRLNCRASLMLLVVYQAMQLSRGWICRNWMGRI